MNQAERTPLNEGRSTTFGYISNTIADNPSSYDVVLMDFDPRCVEDPIQWAFDHMGGDGGQGRVDQVIREILSHPIAASETTQPEWGDAMTFGVFTSETAYGPPNFTGGGMASQFSPNSWINKNPSDHPYHDVSMDLANIAKDAPNYHPWRLARVLDEIKEAGLPVVAPAGDNRTQNDVTGEGNLQTIIGLSQLDSVITVGAAATTFLAPNSGVGLTRMGTLKPDLLAPGYQSIWIPKRSWLHDQACVFGGVHWENYDCQSLEFARPTYVPSAPSQVEVLTPNQGEFGSTYISSAIVAAQVLTLRNLWPGGWPGGDMTGVVRSVLQAKSVRLPGVAPYEQGAGLLDGFVIGSDVSNHALPETPLNLPVESAAYSCDSSCPVGATTTFYTGGATVTGVTATVSWLEGGDVTGSARSASISNTADATQTVTPTYGCNGATPSSCQVSMTVVGQSTWAGVYCGWYKVSGTVSSVTTGASYPFCSPRAFPLKFHVYYPESRPVANDVVSLDLYDPLYLYGIGPYEFMPIVSDPNNYREEEWPAGGEPYGMWLGPPNLTVYSGNTDSNGDVVFYDVMPGLYNLKVYGDYGVTGVVGTTTTANYPTNTTASVTYTANQMGSKINYADMWPLAISSPVACPDEAAEASRVTNTVNAGLPVWLACRPSREAWLDNASDEKAFKYYYDENDGFCLQPATPVGDTPQAFRRRWASLFGPDSPPPDAPPPPAEIGFICPETPTSSVTATVNVRMGVGFVSQRIKTLKFGTPSVSQTLDYEMSDPDVPSDQQTQHDFAYGICNYTTYHTRFHFQEFPGNCVAAPPGSWTWSTCSACDHPGATESVEMSLDPLTTTNPTPGAKIPIGYLHHRASLPRPNYTAHLDLSFGYRSTNTIIAIVARAGEDVRAAITSFSGYSYSVGPVFAAAWPNDPLANLYTEIEACSSSCVTVTPTGTVVDPSYTDIKGRATVSFDFPKARNADHADIFILAAPTSWMDPAIVRLDHMGYAISTQDKPKWCRPYYCWEEIADDFVTMTTTYPTSTTDVDPSHTDSTDTLRLNFQSSLATKDAYPGDWNCWDDFGCDEMFVSFGAPKGSPSGTADEECGTYSKILDVVERKKTTTASDVLTWQRGTGTVERMQLAQAFPTSYVSTATVTVDASGFPALLTSQAYEWWNVEHNGAAVVTQGVLARAARGDPELGRMSARVTTSACTSSSPTNYANYQTCTAAEPAGSKLPTIPYSETPPRHCRPYTIEPRRGTMLEVGQIYSTWALQIFPPVYCVYILVYGEGPYWGPFIQRQMQTPGC